MPVLEVDSCEVNPARAGMILRRDDLALEIVGKPRASGDDPLGLNPETETEA